MDLQHSGTRPVDAEVARWAADRAASAHLKRGTNAVATLAFFARVAVYPTAAAGRRVAHDVDTGIEAESHPTGTIADPLVAFLALDGLAADATAAAVLVGIVDIRLAAVETFPVAVGLTRSAYLRRVASAE